MRTCYDFWRARSREEVPVSALSDEHTRWIEQTLSSHSDRQFRDQTARQEARELLGWALERLSPENRAVLTLVHLDGYSVREAADMAALLGALPLAIGAGVGSELRHPLGIAIIGGLIVSQALTLYTTPVVYLAFDRLARRVNARRLTEPQANLLTPGSA